MMPGMACAVLGAYDQHVAAVAVGDHLLLQVLRRCPCRAGTTRASSRSLPRCLRSRSRISRSSGLASSATSPDASICLAHRRAISPLERGQAVRRAAEARERRRGSRRMTARAWSIESRNVGEAEQPQRLERPSGDGQRGERVGEVRRRAQREGRMAVEQTHAFRRLGQGGATAGAPPSGCELASAVGAERRQREARQRLDDASELERPEGAWMHAMSVEPCWPTCQAVQPLIVARPRRTGSEPISRQAGG